MEQPSPNNQLSTMEPHEAMMQNERIMLSIVASMKEIPVLPSEVPKDTKPLLKVEFPPEGGILTYMQDHEYPYRGFPFYEFVDKIDYFKKTTRATLSGLYHELKHKHRITLFTLLPAFWVFKSLVRTGIYIFYRMVERVRVKKEIYCQAVREIHRAFSLERKNESAEAREIRLRLRDLLCMVLEFDNAYRFRFQDVIVELDKNELGKKPLKELNRILDILSAREKGQDIKDTWTLCKLFVSLYLRYDKELRLLLADTLGQLDLEKVALTPEDKHYCAPRTDYNFSFMQK